MKKIPEGGSLELQPAALYLEEVKEFYDIIASEHPIGLRVTAEGHELAGFEELEQLRAATGKRKLGSFLISAQSPSISISYETGAGRIHFDSESTVAHGLQSKLRATWEKSRRKGFEYSSFIFYFALMFMAYKSGEVGAAFVGVLFTCIPLVMFAGLIDFAMKRLRTVVYWSYRTERQTFWHRNSDKVVLAVIAAIVGGICTVLVTWAKSKFFGM